jgi:hypothetical protein
VTLIDFDLVNVAARAVEERVRMLIALGRLGPLDLVDNGRFGLEFGGDLLVDLFNALAPSSGLFPDRFELLVDRLERFDDLLQLVAQLSEFVCCWCRLPRR